MKRIDAFERKKYLNLETFRRNGAAMRTPVWFVRDGDLLYVRTIANSGKVKRARNNPQVNIAPCRVEGTVTGDWVPALAREVGGEEIDRKVDRLLDRKYGLIKKAMALQAVKEGRSYTILEIKILEEGS